MNDAQKDLGDYLSAMETLKVARPGSRIFAMAVEERKRVKDNMYDVPVPCLLCGNKYPMTVSVADIATWAGAPRGVCMDCDGEIAITLIETDSKGDTK